MSPAPFRLPHFIILSLFLLLPVIVLAQTSPSGGDWYEINWPNGFPGTTDDVVINHEVTIPADSLVEINNLTIGRGGKLTINGSLVINGKVELANGSLGFINSTSSTTVVFGDFDAGNQIHLTISGYFIVYGNLSKSGSTNHTDLVIEDANIYVFGGVYGNGWPDQFGCPDSAYDGNTPDPGTPEDCDYGSEEDFYNHRDDFPPEIIDLLNCHDLSQLVDQEVCENETAIFFIKDHNEASYQWQLKSPGGDWNDLPGENSYILNFPEVSFSLSGNEYRVLVTTLNQEDYPCTTSISKAVSLTVERSGVWKGGASSSWNTASNWSCELIPDSTTDVTIPSDVNHFPVISEGFTGSGRSINIEAGAQLTVNGSLNVHESIVSAQALNAKTGTIVFKGNTAQSIPAGTFVNNRVKNIMINHSDIVSSQGDLEITGILKVENGTFHTGNRLTLISNEEQTALIDGSGSGEIEGMVKIQRLLDPAFGYKYFSSPFNGTTVGDFAGFVDLDADFPNFYRYIEDRHIQIKNGDSVATGWESYTNSLSPLEVMRGYALNFGGSNSDPSTVEISGIVNNASYSLSLENNNRKFTKGFHLVGNPYPSPIDWNASEGWTKENIDDAIHFFTASENDRYTGTYRSYVPNGVTSDGETSSSIIPSMQGFFVHVSNNTSGSYPVTGKLGMTNEVRVNDFEQSFYKSAEKQIPLIRLSAGYKNETISDPTVIYFDPIAKTSFDKKLDALKLMNTDLKVPNFYSILPNTSQLSINAVDYPFSEKELRIPLGINAKRSGAMEIRLQDMENLPSDVYIYLLDLEKRIVQNISQDPVYPFNLKKGEHNSRFELVISRFPLSDEAVDFKEPFSVKVSEGRTFVNLNLDSTQKGIVRVNTLTGQLLETKKGSGSDIMEFQGINSSGLYIFTLETGSSKYSKKILIKK